MAVDRRVQRFLEDGYLAVPRFLDDGLLERIRADSAAELTKVEADPVEDPLVVYEKRGEDQPRIVRRLSRVIDRDEIHRHVACPAAAFARVKFARVKKGRRHGPIPPV